MVKNLTVNAGDIRDVGSIPGSGRSHGGGNGKPLQYSFLQNPWTEEPVGLQSIGSQRGGHDCSDLSHTHITDSLCYTEETNTTLKINYTAIKFNKKKKRKKKTLYSSRSQKYILLGRNTSQTILTNGQNSQISPSQIKLLSII